ncbi:hypothetical protein [Phreatobacter stygius]|uniref:Uncharacterized protein n=1 Tax=Phreatobacter stygius TaxID=1940610 RepID=A0A4D7B2Q9_9HYPH|nr:hypothetical protein [Phreatobacter stygius]QCI64868.1 hypothetical protein E8M01_11915 [Phreatobacter stygius]
MMPLRRTVVHCFLLAGLGLGLSGLGLPGLGLTRHAMAQVRIPGDPATPGGPLGLPLGSGDPQQQILQQQQQLQQQQRDRDAQQLQQQQIQRQQIQDQQRWQRSLQQQQRGEQVQPRFQPQPVQGRRPSPPITRQPPPSDQGSDCRTVERRLRGGRVVQRRECRVCDPPIENYGVLVEARRPRCRVVSRPVG